MKGKVKKKAQLRVHKKKATRVAAKSKPNVGKRSNKGRGKKSQSKVKKKPLVTVTRSRKVKKKKALVTVTRPPKKSQRERQLEQQVQELQQQLTVNKRSEAAKKGWATRRAKITAQQTEVAETKAASIDEIISARIGSESVTEEAFLERQQHLREPHVQRQIQQRLVEKMPEFFLRDHEEYFQQKEPQIMLRLIIAEQEGDFEDIVREMADDYEYDAHSIYDLWYGYDLEG